MTMNRTHSVTFPSYDDVMIAAGHEEADDEMTEALALQRMIDAGQWGFEGSVGRAMMAAIEAGACMLGERPARDYWGNRIPSRHEVKAGTKGSRDYVAERMGECWAAALEA
jgi:hypothetical protein